MYVDVDPDPMANTSSTELINVDTESSMHECPRPLWPLKCGGHLSSPFHQAFFDVKSDRLINKISLAVPAGFVVLGGVTVIIH